MQPQQTKRQKRPRQESEPTKNKRMRTDEPVDVTDPPPIDVLHIIHSFMEYDTMLEVCREWMDCLLKWSHCVRLVKYCQVASQRPWRYEAVLSNPAYVWERETDDFKHVRKPTASEALIEVASCGWVDVVKLFLKAPHVDPTLNECKVLWNTCSEGYHKVVECLLQDSRIDPNIGNGRALREAVTRPRSNAVRVLFADPRVKPDYLTYEDLRLCFSSQEFHTISVLNQDPRIRSMNCFPKLMREFILLLTDRLDLLFGFLRLNPDDEWEYACIMRDMVRDRLESTTVWGRRRWQMEIQEWYMEYEKRHGREYREEDDTFSILPIPELPPSDLDGYTCYALA